MTPTGDEPFLASLGLRIRVLRTGARMTQQQLAEACGLSRVGVSYLETGRHAPNILTLRHLASALGVPLADLLSEDTAAIRLAPMAGSDSPPAPRRR